MQWTNRCNIQARSRNHSCCGKAKSTTYSEYVLVALVIQHAMRMLQTVICGLPESTIFFHTISQTARFSKKKKGKRYSKSWYWILWINCMFPFSVQSFSETFLILGRIERDVIKNAYWPSPKLRVILSYLNETWIFSTYFRKTINYQFSRKPSSGVDLFHADGRTDVWTDRQTQRNEESLIAICKRA